MTPLIKKVTLLLNITRQHSRPILLCCMYVFMATHQYQLKMIQVDTLVFSDWLQNIKSPSEIGDIREKIVRHCLPKQL